MSWQKFITLFSRASVHGVIFSKVTTNPLMRVTSMWTLVATLIWSVPPHMLMPCRSGTPVYKLQVKTKSKTCDRVLPCTLLFRTLPPCRDELWRRHVFCSSRPRHLARQAPTLPCAPRPRTSPLCHSRLWCCHVSYGPEPHLLAVEGFSATACPIVPYHTSLPRWAPARLRVSLPSVSYKP
jgi:hypothetical protein